MAKNNPSRAGGRKSGVSNYSRTEVMEFLHTVKAILPVGPEEWEQVAQIHKDNFPDTDRSVQNLSERQQRETALESLKAAIVDVATIFWRIWVEFDLKGRLHPRHLTRDGVYDGDGSDFDSCTLMRIK
eukprot:jgi/Psemu1/50156/gm1.50156_g